MKNNHRKSNHRNDKFETTNPILLEKSAVVNVYNVHLALQNAKITSSFKELEQKVHCALPRRTK